MATENLFKNETKIEELDEKYDFKISEPEIKKLLAHLQKIELAAGEKMSKSEKKILSDDITETFNRLDTAAAERETVLNILKAKPHTIYQNSFGGGLYIPKIESIISEIDEALDDYYENTEDQVEKVDTEEEVREEGSIQEPLDVEKKAETTPEDIELSINTSIIEYAGTKAALVESESLETKLQTKDNTETNEPEQEHPTLNDQQRSLLPGAANENTLDAALRNNKNVPKPTSKPELPPENNLLEEGTLLTYNSAIKNLIESPDKETKAHFKKEHSDLIRNLKETLLTKKQDEGDAATDEFISKQQENIVDLIRPIHTNGTKQGAVLLRTLKTDLQQLDTYKSTYIPEKTKNEDSAEFKPIDFDAILTHENKAILETNPDLFGKVRAAIDTYNQNISSDVESNDIKKSFEAIQELQNEFIVYRETHTDKKPEKSGESAVFKRIALGDPTDPFYVSPENKGIMENTGFIIQIAEAVNTYNSLVDSQAKTEDIEEALKKIEGLRSKFNEYTDPKFKKPKATQPPVGKKLAVHQINDKYYDYADYNKHVDRNSDKTDPEYKGYSAVRTYHDNDFEDTEEISKRIEKDGLYEKSKKKQPSAKPKNTVPAPEATPVTPAAETKPEPTAIPAPEVVPTPTPEDTETELFFTVEGKDYSKIAEDEGFDTWFTNISNIIKTEGIFIKDEIKDLDAWYQKYQESIPYAKKLNTIYEDIKKTEGQNGITLRATEIKIDSLLFNLYRNGDEAKEKIDKVFSDFEESKKKETEVERLKKSDELRTKISTQRSRHGKTRDLRTDEVKTLLETRGEENTRENIEELIVFLQDMDNNYSFYANQNENVRDDMMYVYKKYTAAKEKAVKEKSNGEKSVKKLGWLSRLTSRINASWPSDVDAVDYSNTTDLIRKVRSLNLVDRKDGSMTGAITNKAKMSNLIAFCNGQKELLIEHLQNPQSNKEAEFTEAEDKELLKLFDSMMKTFTESKYRGGDAKAKAERVLEKRETIPETEIESIKSSTEILFDDTEERELFETEATAQVYRAALVNLYSELTKFPKTGKNVTKLVELETRYNLIKDTLKEHDDSDGTTKMNLDKVSLKLKELSIKHTDKDTYKELSGSFKNYDDIINSPLTKKADKITYVNELITALEAIKAKSGSKIVQNYILNGTIKKYQEVLAALNK